MAHNSLWPGFVAVRYESNSHEHLMRIPVYADGLGETPSGVDFEAVQVWDGNDLEVNLSTSLLAYLNVVKAIFHTSTSFIGADLWVYDTPDSDPRWASSKELSTVGTSSGSLLSYGQAIITYRSKNGGIARHYFMEPAAVNNQVLSPPYPTSTEVAAIVTYVKSVAGGWIRARDNGRLVTSIHWTTKINDQLRKKYVLNT